MPLRQYVAQLYGNVNDAGKGRQLGCIRVTATRTMSSCRRASPRRRRTPSASPWPCASPATPGRSSSAMSAMARPARATSRRRPTLRGCSRPPLVLFCQNNQWAISTPGSLQTASQTIAVKGPRLRSRQLPRRWQRRPRRLRGDPAGRGPGAGPARARPHRGADLSHRRALVVRRTRRATAMSPSPRSGRPRGPHRALRNLPRGAGLAG